MSDYIKLAVAAFLPVAATIVLFLLDNKTPFKKIKFPIIKQIVFGIVFGGLAIIGTEWGISIADAQVNCRDAAVISAGLLFGAPAGIIAGLIGGIERWFAVAWGVGCYTRTACSISTILAGIYAGALRKFLFENKKPGWLMALAIGVVMEVFHLTMVFFTNIDTASRAMTVVASCSAPMIISNGLSVMFSTMAVTLFSKERFLFRHNKKQISQTVQKWLLIVVACVFLITSLFVFQLQSGLAVTQLNLQLDNSLTDISEDIKSMSDDNLIKCAKNIRDDLNEKSPEELLKEYNVSEINLINKEGIITNSTNPDFVGFNMYSGSQSEAFTCLLNGREEYAQEYGPIAKNAEISRKYVGVKTDTGFVQIGFDSTTFYDNIIEAANKITQNRRVGNEGFTIVLDENDKIISAPKWLATKSIADGIAEINFAEISENKKVNELPDVTIGGNEYFYLVKKMEGCKIVSFVSYSETYQLRDIAVYVNSFMEILVYAIMFIFIYLIIKFVVVVQIKKINKSLARITQGNLEEEVNVRSNAEFASLSDDINTTVDTLKMYIDEATKRIDKELEFAKNIQYSALPNIFPAFPKRTDFDIFAMMDTAKEVGGDFYDFYLTNKNTINFLIADVSGKGIPAALFMMRAKTELKSLTESDISLDNVFTNGNKALCEGNDAGMFVTAWQGSLDLTSGKLSYVNAGHNPPLIRHQDGKFEYLKSRVGFVLAGMDGVKYKLQQMELAPGDTIFLYTDGVTEATNGNNELFGEDRLLECINSKEFADMKEICQFVKANVDEFVGEAPQFDDITMLAIKYNGKKESPRIEFDRASIDDIPEVTDFVDSLLEEIECPIKAQVQLNIAIDEIYSNIAKFAYKDGNGPVCVKVSLLDEPNGVRLTFVDMGTPYNPLTKADPDVTLSAEERKIGGLGIYMVKKTMDDMQYRYVDNKNILIIKKYF